MFSDRQTNVQRVKDQKR